MVKEAEANKEEDKKKKELVDTKNDIEQLIYATEKAIKDLGDKVDSKDKDAAEEAIKEAKEALESDDIDKLKKAKENLNDKAMELGKKVYEEAAKANQANSESKEEKEEKKDNVQDAEYEEK